MQTFLPGLPTFAGVFITFICVYIMINSKNNIYIHVYKL